jgi:outer membrane lipoprotein SlyB
LKFSVWLSLIVEFLDLCIGRLFKLGIVFYVMRFGRKGEMTSQQIVVLVILIVSFAVLIYFLTQFGFSDTDKEVCHNSVVTRGTIVSSDSVTPLNCKRSYVCLTEDGSCESMTKPVKIKVKSQDDVYEALSKELADCWWMYGEGKIDYVGKDLFDKLYCSFCSQVAFDDSVLDLFDGGKISKDELFYYMSRHNRSDSGRTYSMYLYNTNDVKSIWSGEFGDIDLSRQVYVMMGITSKVSNVGWIATAGVVTGGAALLFFSGPVGWIAGAIAATAGGVAGNYIASVVKGDSGNEFLSPLVVEVNSDEYKSLKCDRIVSSS